MRFLLLLLAACGCHPTPIVAVPRVEVIDAGEPKKPCALDVVFIVDFSSSMDGKLEGIRNKIEKLDPVNRYALVGSPDSDATHDGWVVVVKDFGTLADLKSYMRSNKWRATGGDREPTIDALAQVLDQTNPLDLHWESENQWRVVLFTDEKPQSFTTPFNRLEDLPEFSSLVGDVQIFTTEELVDRWLPPHGLVAPMTFSPVLVCP